ncbi:MAG: hypothetical protein A2X34_09875 [Elusimicrobia bacterium GWC2_51_8]|nr:MAG: hypothetical protein A2X33_01870 [Elusimicrobia bacterium GWA2_51_34]OGR61456.1 MAG: hypothetical protein A2X34_09875 [Elusimicrobia bacterium GWC2_51_8]OGR85112.1 MAG: hypothetical protein A2021_09280 [Elusimicrobia bacterium GWF2_52_66]HAF94549.1 hypothetical protein [Elusimicrobiota bacterium]HBO83477.1 hypothetical protein [Deltaproteobacteria bacterium]
MNSRPDQNYWKYAQIGLELAVSVLLGFWAGYWLDGKMGTSPWLMLGGAAGGMAAGFYLVMKELFRKEGE